MLASILTDIRYRCWYRHWHTLSMLVSILTCDIDVGINHDVQYRYWYTISMLLSIPEIGVGIYWYPILIYFVWSWYSYRISTYHAWQCGSHGVHENLRGKGGERGNAVTGRVRYRHCSYWKVISIPYRHSVLIFDIDIRYQGVDARRSTRGPPRQRVAEATGYANICETERNIL